MSRSAGQRIPALLKWYEQERRGLIATESKTPEESLTTAEQIRAYDLFCAAYFIKKVSRRS